MSKAKVHLSETQSFEHIFNAVKDKEHLGGTENEHRSCRGNPR